MTNSALKPCRHVACKKLVKESGYCETHAKKRQKAADEKRGSSNDRGYGYKWQIESKAFLQLNPLCVCPECLSNPHKQLLANVVDHIKPHKLKEAKQSKNPLLIKEAQRLFWSRSNWQAMNKLCHDKKTARENGGFGNAAKLPSLQASNPNQSNKPALMIY